LKNTRENEKKTMLYDGNWQNIRGNVQLKSKFNKFEKKLNDLQQVWNVVVELVRCSTNENPPSVDINFLCTFLVKKNFIIPIDTHVYSSESNIVQVKILFCFKLIKVKLKHDKKNIEIKLKICLVIKVIK